MRRSTSTVRRACALGTTAALVVLTTGLGIMTATAAHAAPEDTDGSVSTSAGPTQTPAPAPAETPAPTTTSSATSTPAPTGESTPTPTESTTPTPSLLPHLRSSAPATGDAADASTTAAAAPTVTISGDAKVGSTLRATTTGFDKQLAPLAFSWTNEATGDELGTDQFYDIKPTDVGAVIVVTVSGKDSTGTAVEAQAQTTTEITQDPVFVDETGTPLDSGSEADEDTFFLPQDAVAGEAYSYTFRAQGYPAPTYELAWYYGTEEDTLGTVVSTQEQSELGFGSETDADTNGDGKITPDDQLPKGITFDPTTGELSGTATEASSFDFAVTATSGDVTTTVYAELTVDPGAAYGLAAVALDKGLIDDRKGAYYIIRPDGTVIGLDLDISDDDSFSGSELDVLDHVSVKQGGTLLVYGTPVDRFGNDVYPEDENDDTTVQATVTSNVASDVIKPYTEHGAAGFGVSSVTFPHAS
ncbi:putative Ig domain-containing protein, partial [Curtobacterium luteum]